MKYEVIFNSSREVQEFYRCFIWSMRGRSKENGQRTTIEVETLLFADFILNFIENSDWEYPLTIKYQDRPDFVIESNKSSIGIEITEQWSNNYGQVLSISENLDGFIERSDFNIETDIKKIKGNEIEKLISKKHLTGPPTMRYQEEENWIKRTKMTIENKEKKYIKYPKFKEFNENFLIIFDVRAEFPLFGDISDEMLKPLYALGKQNLFSKVFCMDDHIVSIDLIKKNFVVVRQQHKN